MSNKVSFKEINKLAIPAIIAGIAEPIISLTDIAIVGNVKIHSVEALAAAGIVGSFLSAIIWIVAQLQTAISAVVSQHYGARRLHAVKTLIPQVLLFSFIISLIIFGITTVFTEFIFRAYNAEGLILEYSKSYYRIRAIGYPLTLITFSLFGVFRGLQNTLWAMICSITGAVINVILDYLLVYGWGDFIPAMHLEGAAWASVVAQTVMFGIALYFFIRKTPFHFRLSWTVNPELKPLLLMAANLFVRTIALNVAIFMANAYATGYGGKYIATQSILMNIWLFFSFFIDGYSDAGNAIGGRLFGARAYKKLWQLTLDVTKYAIVIACVLMFTCFVFYDEIGRLFNKDAAVLLVFASSFWMVVLVQPINAVTYVFDGIFKGLGEAKYLRNSQIVATFFGFIPVLLIGDYLGGKLYAIWTAFAVWMLIRGGALVWRFRKKYL